jgi:hypothetical protein
MSDDTTEVDEVEEEVEDEEVESVARKIEKASFALQAEAEGPFESGAQERLDRLGGFESPEDS